MGIKQVEDQFRLEWRDGVAVLAHIRTGAVAHSPVEESDDVQLLLFCLESNYHNSERAPSQKPTKTLFERLMEHPSNGHC